MGILTWSTVRNLNCNFVHKTVCPSEEQRTAGISTRYYNRSVYLGIGEKQEQMMFGKYLLLQLIKPAHGERFIRDHPEPERLRTQPPQYHVTTVPVPSQDPADRCWAGAAGSGPQPSPLGDHHPPCPISVFLAGDRQATFTSLNFSFFTSKQG